MKKTMKRLQLLPFAIVVLCLCACSSGGSDTHDTPNPPHQPTRFPISISTSLVSRVSDTGFDHADCIGLFVVNHNADGSAATLLAKGNYVDNMRFTYSGTWTPDTPIYWDDETTHADFYLYYPYQSGIADVTTMPVTVRSDQSTVDNYKASEIVAGSTFNVAPTAQAVAITAHHLMSQLVIRVAAGNGFTTEKLVAAQVAVKVNGVKTQALVDIAHAKVVATGDATSVTPLFADGKYKALIVPQTVAKTNLVTVTVDGRDFNLPKAFTFAGGKSYQMTVTVSKTSNGINVNITDWDSDGTDYGGTAE
jgi:hypothetical protein